MTNWYRNNVRVQKLLLFMMVKSQRQEYFSGGGMIDMNIYTYGSVSSKYILQKQSLIFFCLQIVRKTFSFYALLRTVFNK